MNTEPTMLDGTGLDLHAGIQNGISELEQRREYGLVANYADRYAEAQAEQDTVVMNNRLHDLLDDIRSDLGE